MSLSLICSKSDPRVHSSTHFPLLHHSRRTIRYFSFITQATLNNFLLIMILEENLLFTHHTTRQLNQVGSVQSSIEFFTVTLSPNPASAMVC